MQLHDIITFSDSGINADLFANTRVSEIGSDYIRLTQPIVLTATLTNVKFDVTLNEEFINTNGAGQNTFTLILVWHLLKLVISLEELILVFFLDQEQQPIQYLIIVEKNRANNLFILG